MRQSSELAKAVCRTDIVLKVIYTGSETREYMTMTQSLVTFLQFKTSPPKETAQTLFEEEKSRTEGTTRRRTPTNTTVKTQTIRDTMEEST